MSTVLRKRFSGWRSNKLEIKFWMIFLTYRHLTNFLKGRVSIDLEHTIQLLYRCDTQEQCKWKTTLLDGLSWRPQSIKNRKMAVAKFFFPLQENFTLLISKTGNINNETLLLSAMPSLNKMSGTGLTLVTLLIKSLATFSLARRTKNVRLSPWKRAI